MVYKIDSKLVQDGIPRLNFKNPNYYMYISKNDYKNIKIINDEYKMNDYEFYMAENKDKFNLDEVYFGFQNYGKPYIEKSKISLMMFKQINDDIYMELIEEKDLEFSKITKEIVNHQELEDLYRKNDNIKYRIYFNSLYEHSFIDEIEENSLEFANPDGSRVFISVDASLRTCPPSFPSFLTLYRRDKKKLVNLYNESMQPHYIDLMDYYRSEYEIKKRKEEFYKDTSWQINNVEQIKRFPLFHHNDVPAYKHTNESDYDITDGLFYIVYYYDDETVEINLLDVYCLGYDKYEVVSKKCLIKKNDFALVNGNMPNNEVIYHEQEITEIKDEPKKRSILRKVFKF